MSDKELLVVGGPNGAGKSTFVTRLLRERHRAYLCVDLIAMEFKHLDTLSQQFEAGGEFIRRIESRSYFLVTTSSSNRRSRDAHFAGFCRGHTIRGTTSPSLLFMLFPPRHV
jgi:predicted ABC-type ATPase